MLAIIGYIVSILMGLSLGMIGGGGSILTVPILVYLFQVPPIQATAYSLFIVGSTAFVGGLSYLRKGDVDLKTGFIFAVPSFIGVYLTRAYVVPNLPDPVFSFSDIAISKPLFIMIVFGVLMVFASMSMIKKKKNQTEPNTLSATTKVTLIALEGLLVGGVTGFVGAGGGFLIIPALVVLVGMPMKLAVGTSLFIIAAKSLIGFTGDLQHGITIEWQLILTITAIAICGLFVGMRFSSLVPEATLKRGFGFFVLIVGSIVLLDQVRGILMAN